MCLTSSTTVVDSLVQPLAVHTSMGMEGCFSSVTVPTCWPSTRLAKESAANVRNIVRSAGSGDCFRERRNRRQKTGVVERGML